MLGSQDYSPISKSKMIKPDSFLNPTNKANPFPKRLISKKIKEMP